jgi:hypothetical protein
MGRGGASDPPVCLRPLPAATRLRPCPTGPGSRSRPAPPTPATRPRPRPPPRARSPPPRRGRRRSTSPRCSQPQPRPAGPQPRCRRRSRSCRHAELVGQGSECAGGGADSYSGAAGIFLGIELTRKFGKWGWGGRRGSVLRMARTTLSLRDFELSRQLEAQSRLEHRLDLSTLRAPACAAAPAFELSSAAAPLLRVAGQSECHYPWRPACWTLPDRSLEAPVPSWV